MRQRPVTTPVYLIGTADDCDLVLGDPQFPQLHTYLFVTRDGVTARFLGDGPALSVGGRSVETVALKDRDHLVAGSYDFVIRIKYPDRLKNSDSQEREWYETVEHHYRSAVTNDVYALLDDVRLFVKEDRSTVHLASPFVSHKEHMRRKIA